jgi:murein DD-endopeptidase MepM/ murein hydrolase activator NlpD
MDGLGSVRSQEHPAVSAIATARAIALRPALLIGRFIAADITSPQPTISREFGRPSLRAAGFRKENMGRSATSKNLRSDRLASASRRLLQIAAALGCFVSVPGQAVEADCANGVCIEVERAERGAAFFALNQLAAPVSLLLEFPVLDNMTSSATLPVKSVVLPGARKLLVQIRTDDRAESTRWRWSWRWTTGVLGARHAANARYWIPWAPNLRFEVGQAVGGTFTHTGKWRFAFDFWMPSGTPIRAARGGTVVRVVEDFSRSGTEEHFKKRANAIFILHEDGTIARYLHLQRDGAHAEVGDRVAAGDLIGSSGDTGYSQNPHLHFDVFSVDENLEWQTVDLRFATNTSDGFRPESGQVLNGGARQAGPGR